MANSVLKSKTPSDVYFLAGRAQQELVSRMKAVNRKHGDRIRKLRDVMNKISCAEVDSAETLEGVDGISLDPETELLILNPTHDL